MAAITVDGLSDEVLELLNQRAQNRGTDLQHVVRELIHLGVSLELARRDSLNVDFGAMVEALDGPKPLDVIDGLGSFDTLDLEQVWG